MGGFWNLSAPSGEVESLRERPCVLAFRALLYGEVMENAAEGAGIVFRLDAASVRRAADCLQRIPGACDDQISLEMIVT